MYLFNSIQILTEILLLDSKAFIFINMRRRMNTNEDLHGKKRWKRHRNFNSRFSMYTQKEEQLEMSRTSADASIFRALPKSRFHQESLAFPPSVPNLVIVSIDYSHSYFCVVTAVVPTCILLTQLPDATSWVSTLAGPHLSMRAKTILVEGNVQVPFITAS